MGIVYMLCFAHNPVGHSRHYVGYAHSQRTLEKRLHAHAHGSNGARLMRELRSRGGTFLVARTWENVPQSFERKLKNRKNTPRYCPLCG